MNVILFKGNSVDLIKECTTPLKRVRVEAGWDVVEGKTVDIDLWGATKGDKAVFYKNRQAVTGITLSEDNRTGDTEGEKMVIDTEALASSVTAIFLNIYDAAATSQSLKDVRGAWITFINDETNEVIVTLDLSGKGGRNYTILAGDLIKDTDSLWFRALVDYSRKGPEVICAKYESQIEVEQ